MKTPALGQMETHSFQSWLRPDRNPFYLITIACTFTLTFSAEIQIFQQKWNFLYYLIAFILLLNLALSIFPQEMEKEEYDKNLRFARTLGIMTATLSLVFLRQALYLPDPPVTWVFVLITIQIFVFTIYLFIAILKKNSTVYNHKKKINNFQLCLITSSLLLGIVVNYNYSVNSEGIKDNYISKELLSSVIISIDEQHNDLFSPRNLSKGNYKIDTTEAQLTLGNISTSLGALKNNNTIGITSDEKGRHEQVVALLIICWAICMLTWIYQLRNVFNIKVNLENSPE
jgi:hypothetical protein